MNKEESRVNWEDKCKMLWVVYTSEHKHNCCWCNDCLPCDGDTVGIQFNPLHLTSRRWTLAGLLTCPFMWGCRCLNISSSTHFAVACQWTESLLRTSMFSSVLSSSSHLTNGQHPPFDVLMIRHHIHHMLICALQLNQSLGLHYFCPIPSTPVFSWSSVDGKTFTTLIDDTYRVVVYWKRNLFRVPWGKLGKVFVSELSRLFRKYTNDSMLQRVALKVAMMMSSLLLQCFHLHSKQKEEILCFETRLSLWSDGDIPILLKDGQLIQGCIPLSRQLKSQEGNHKATFFCQVCHERQH